MYFLAVMNLSLATSPSSKLDVLLCAGMNIKSLLKGNDRDIEHNSRTASDVAAEPHIAFFFFFARACTVHRSA